MRTWKQHRLILKCCRNSVRLYAGTVTVTKFSTVTGWLTIRLSLCCQVLDIADSPKHSAAAASIKFQSSSSAAASTHTCTKLHATVTATFFSAIFAILPQKNMRYKHKQSQWLRCGCYSNTSSQSGQQRSVVFLQIWLPSRCSLADGKRLPETTCPRYSALPSSNSSLLTSAGTASVCVEATVLLITCTRKT